jgi:hypothetical protein
MANAIGIGKMKTIFMTLMISVLARALLKSLLPKMSMKCFKPAQGLLKTDMNGVSAANML